MRIAFGQINTTIGDFAANCSRMLEFYGRARAGADVVLFPELAICGYPPRDLLLRPQFVTDNLKALDHLAAQISGPPVIVGYVDRNSGVGRPLRNAAAVIEKGKITHRIFKTLLPTYDVFDEDRYFEPGENPKAIQLAGHLVGITICEDIWNDEDFWPSRIYRQDPVRELKAQGIELLLNISASPWHWKKEETRYRMLQTISRNDRLPIAYCNAVGGNDELIFDGQSIAFGAAGNLLAHAKAFEEDLLIVNIETESNKVGTPPLFLSPEHGRMGGVCPSAESGEPVPNLPTDHLANLYKALVLGLGDYVRKCGFKSVVLGLSGGIDSALTACIAVSALGRENVLGVAMPSRFSSEGSIRDAESLAKNLSIRFELIPIHEQVDAFRKALGPIFQGTTEDTTEENLQSRIRGVTLMALSNKFGSLLVTTGNKSELATGYCTLYGDMCGGLAVISDLSKMQVYDLSKWINTHPEITTLPPLAIPEDTITKPPSAELKPDQCDQDTLPPYKILDEILGAYVENHRPTQEIIAMGFDPILVRELTRKIDLNEYKRRQAAPGLRITSKAFGIGRRIPIAQRYSES